MFHFIGKKWNGHERMYVDTLYPIISNHGLNIVVLFMRSKWHTHLSQMGLPRKWTGCNLTFLRHCCEILIFTTQNTSGLRQLVQHTIFETVYHPETLCNLAHHTKYLWDENRFSHTWEHLFVMNLWTYQRKYKVEIFQLFQKNGCLLATVTDQDTEYIFLERRNSLKHQMLHLMNIGRWKAGKLYGAKFCWIVNSINGREWPKRIGRRRSEFQ